jgi:hypothetical protein
MRLKTPACKAASSISPLPNLATPSFTQLNITASFYFPLVSCRSHGEQRETDAQFSERIQREETLN